MEYLSYCRGVTPPTDRGPSDPSDEGDAAPVNPPANNTDATDALKDAATPARHDVQAIERMVRDYVKILKQQGFQPERAVTAAEALVVEATGDPASEILPSVITWTLSVYYDR